MTTESPRNIASQKKIPSAENTSPLLGGCDLLNLDVDRRVAIAIATCLNSHEHR